MKSLVFIFVLASTIAGAWAVPNKLLPDLFMGVAWRNKMTWILFAYGFLAASWMFIWLNLLGRLFKKNPPEKSAQTAAFPVRGTSATPQTSAKQTFVPTRMTVQNKGVLPMTENPAQTPMQTTSVPQTQPTSVQQAAISQPTISSKSKLILELADLCQDLDMMAFKNISMGGQLMELVYSSDFSAAICKLLYDNHTYTVDISQPIENCVFQDETGATSNPALTLLKQAATLEKAESEAVIKPVLILAQGNIQNYEQVENYLLQNQITLVKYNQEEPANALTLEAFLVKTFSLIPEGVHDDEEEVAFTEEPLT